MKASFYNHTEATANGLALYNCRTDALVILNAELQQLWEEQSESGQLISLKDIHPSFYNHLERNGFIVPDELNEPADFLKELHTADKDETSYNIIINPTLNCNMRCWYCYEKHRPETHMSTQVMEAIVKLVENKVKNPKLHTFSISFFGGEPLLEFDTVVYPLLLQSNALCKSHGKALSVAFTSNSYLLTPQMVEQLEALDLVSPVSWQITIDGNRDMHNKVRHTALHEATYDTIINSIHLLAEHHMHVLVRFNYQYRNILTFLDVIKDLKSIKAEDRKWVTFSFQRIWQDYDKYQKQAEGEANVEKVLTTYREAGFTQAGSTVRAYRCYADQENGCLINYNGSIYKCTAQDFTAETQEGILTRQGEIKTNERYEQRMQVRYNNTRCTHCKIYPICFGNCTQKLLHAPRKGYCVKGFDADQVTSYIRERMRTLSYSI